MMKQLIQRRGTDNKILKKHLLFQAIYVYSQSGKKKEQELMKTNPCIFLYQNADNQDQMRVKEAIQLITLPTPLFYKVIDCYRRQCCFRFFYAQNFKK